MESQSPDPRSLDSTPQPHPAKRRGVLIGAAAVGAGALAAHLLPSDPAAPVEPASADQTQQGGGYRESQHVLRYYETTRI